MSTEEVLFDRRIKHYKSTQYVCPVHYYHCKNGSCIEDIKPKSNTIGSILLNLFFTGPNSFLSLCTQEVLNILQGNTDSTEWSSCTLNIEFVWFVLYEHRWIIALELGWIYIKTWVESFNEILNTNFFHIQEHLKKKENENLTTI